MKCKNEFEYLIMIVNDHIATLPPSSKVVVMREAQTCASNINAALQDTPPAATGAAPAPVVAPVPAAGSAAPEEPAGADATPGGVVIP